MENETLDLDSMSLEELEALASERGINLDTDPVNIESTDTINTTGQTQELSTEGLTNKQIWEQTEPGEIIPNTLGMRKPRPGISGFAQDVGQGLWENAAPAVGLLDTVTDAVNFATPVHIPDIPKLPKYERNTTQAIRNISGLVIPSLGLRSIALNAASKYHAAGGMASKAPWLY